MNCRIVGAICQDNFDQAQRVLVSFQRKEAHENKKLFTLTILYILTHVST